MNKKILLSILVIGLVASLAGVGLYAIFTDTETGTGTFTAGTLDISVPSASWSTGFDNMKPGDTVTLTITVRNDGTLPLYYTITTALTGDLATIGSNPCVVSDIRVDTVDYAPPPPETLSVEGQGDWEDTVDIDITMPIEAGDTYQGKSGLLTATFDATSSPP